MTPENKHWRWHSVYRRVAQQCTNVVISQAGGLLPNDNAGTESLIPAATTAQKPINSTRPIRLWVVSTASQSRGLRRTRPRYSSSHWPTPHAHNQNSRQQQHLTKLGPPPCQLTHRNANHQVLHTTPLALEDRHSITDKTTAPMLASPLARLIDCLTLTDAVSRRGIRTG